MPEMFNTTNDPHVGLLVDTSDSSKPTASDGDQPPEIPPPPPSTTDPEDA